MADAQDLPFAPKPGDSDDVELALETAVRLHRTSDFAEALEMAAPRGERGGRSFG
ncbi:MAG: hypothetical protein QM784_33875 [Polyangiaceae bacterium]